MLGSANSIGVGHGQLWHVDGREGEGVGLSCNMRPVMQAPRTQPVVLHNILPPHHTHPESELLACCGCCFCHCRGRGCNPSWPETMFACASDQAATDKWLLLPPPAATRAAAAVAVVAAVPAPTPLEPPSQGPAPTVSSGRLLLFCIPQANGEWW